MVWTYKMNVLLARDIFSFTLEGATRKINTRLTHKRNSPGASWFNLHYMGSRILCMYEANYWIHIFRDFTPFWSGTICLSM